MCPLCITTAMLIAGGVASSGGLAAIVIRKFGGKNAVDNDSAQSDPSCLDKERSNRNRPECKSKEKS
jgi:hypothetical protein